MTQALFYKPSFEHLKERIQQAAPELEIALYDEDGRFFLDGKEVAQKDLNPEYFWMHIEMFKAKLALKYINMIEQFPASNKWLHTMNTGLDGLPYASLFNNGVTISNNHSQAIAIAEYVLGQVLAHFQGIAELKQQQQEQTWRYRPFREISDSHWLIIGFGHIGQEVARRAKAFGVNITAVRRSDDGAGLANKVLNLDSIDQELPDADVVVLACASNSSTQSLVDANFLTQMKPGAVIVNIARGDLIVEDELKQALDRGIPSYAILDVFNEEPVPQDSWVWQHPKVALTPHCSNAGSGMVGRSTDLFIENLERMVKGQPLRNLVSENDIT